MGIVLRVLYVHFCLECVRIQYLQKVFLNATFFSITQNTIHCRVLTQRMHILSTTYFRENTHILGVLAKTLNNLQTLLEKQGIEKYSYQSIFQYKVVTITV